MRSSMVFVGLLVGRICYVNMVVFTCSQVAMKTISKGLLRVPEMALRVGTSYYLMWCTLRVF